MLMFLNASVVFVSVVVVVVDVVSFIIVFVFFIIADITLAALEEMKLETKNKTCSK